MKVLEIKNNLVKIAYETADNLALSGFVIIEDEKNPYVAQIMNLKTDATTNYAIVKLLYTFDKEGILKNYNGTIPSLKSTVSKLPSKELLDIIPKENPIIMGELAQQGFQLKIDRSIFENNLLVCSNNLENTTLFINNCISQLDETTVIFDTDGQFDWDKKIVFGKDFRLPLNYDTINFIYDNDLEDVDATSKAIIQDIFLEVQQYTKSLPEGYLPFETFFNVVDSQYKETQITQLVLLKNKLLKYKELNVFAENLKDVLNLSIEIEKNKNIVIDISDMTPALQREIITYTYRVLNNINENIYSFVKINNENSDKKLLKTLIERTNVCTTIICPHEYKYIAELKETAQNLVLFTPLTLQHDFASYNTFLNKLNYDEFILYGAHTQNIPLIVALSEIKETEEEEQPTEEVIEQQVEEEPEQEVLEETDINTETEENDTELVSLNENIEIVDDVENIPQAITENEIVEEEPVIQNILEENDIQEEDINLLEDNEIISEAPIEEEEEEIIEEVPQDIIIEEDPEIEEMPVIEENPYTNIEVPLSQDEIIEQVSKDVDRAFYEKLPQQDDEEAKFEELNIENFADELTEDDLNLIDNLTDENIQLAGEEELNDVEENIETPVVPIYEADDIEEQALQSFEPGDRVSTAKYGEGVVEKMIKYGNKMLCSIEFPNIGRRLLDPAMTEITKL